MIKVEHIDVWGFDGALRGMRNPLNSWERMDSEQKDGVWVIGKNDLKLMRTLFKGGTEHRKYLRMIHVQMDITAPLYWWKEFDTYKVGTVANSCSTMHRISAKEFELDDFSHEHLTPINREILKSIIDCLNMEREAYQRNGGKDLWWQMIQLLPSAYNQRRTVDFSYETAVIMIRQRTGHKLDEWNDFVKVLWGLPYMEEINGEGKEASGEE